MRNPWRYRDSPGIVTAVEKRVMWLRVVRHTCQPSNKSSPKALRLHPLFAGVVVAKGIASMSVTRLSVIVVHALATWHASVQTNNSCFDRSPRAGGKKRKRRRSRA